MPLLDDLNAFGAHVVENLPFYRHRKFIAPKLYDHFALDIHRGTWIFTLSNTPPKRPIVWITMLPSICSVSPLGISIGSRRYPFARGFCFYSKQRNKFLYIPPLCEGQSESHCETLRYRPMSFESFLDSSMISLICKPSPRINS